MNTDVDQLGYEPQVASRLVAKISLACAFIFGLIIVGTCGPTGIISALERAIGLTFLHLLLQAAFSGLSYKAGGWFGIFTMGALIVFFITWSMAGPDWKVPSLLVCSAIVSATAVQVLLRAGISPDAATYRKSF